MIVLEQNTSKRLLILFADRFSQIINKGEIIDRYYNPGDFFDDVCLLLTNDDVIDARTIQSLFGKARVSLRNLPRPRFIHSLGWRPIFLRSWVREGLKLAEEFRPDVIRCYGNVENGYLGAQIRKQLGIPLVVSLHGDCDEDVRGKTPWWPSWRDRLVSERQKYFESETLKAADLVLPVYEPIVPYARKYGARNIRVCYNMTNNKSLRLKNDYRLHGPPTLVSVSRQFRREKNPENIIRAVSRLKVKLTLIGDGPHHNYLRNLAENQKGPGEFEFIKALHNDVLSQRLPNFDIFVVQSQNFEISKSVIEAMLTGLPVVINHRKGAAVPELAGDWVQMVNDHPDSYYEALNELIHSQDKRESLGKRAFVRSQSLYASAKSEQIYVDAYRSVIGSKD